MGGDGQRRPGELTLEKSLCGASTEPLAAQILPQIGLISTGLLSTKSHSESTIFPRCIAIRG